MRVAQTSISSRSSLADARPSTMTKLKGGVSSSTHRATRGSRRIARPFTDRAEVVKTMVLSSSRSIQTGATWGLPSLRTVASFAVRGRSRTKSFHSEPSILAMGKAYAMTAAPEVTRSRIGHPMSTLRIEGGHRLSGSVAVSGAKNSALKLMAASLLARGRTVLTNVPRIADVFTMIEVLRHVGATVAFEADVMTIDASGELRSEAPYELVSRMRASVNVLGPLLARQGHCRVAMPGGCNIGSRGIDLHEQALGRMGASFHFDHGYLEGVAPVLEGRRIVLEYPSRGATENVLTAATLARGRTVIDNAAREPDIVDLAEFLNQMGARVTGAGTSTMAIEGVESLTPATYRVPSDPIEAGALALAVLATRREAELIGARAQDLDVFGGKLADTGARWGATVAGVEVGIDHRPNAVDFA